MVSVNRWGFGSVNRAVKKGEGKEMDQEIKQQIERTLKAVDFILKLVHIHAPSIRLKGSQVTYWKMLYIPASILLRKLEKDEP